MKLIQLQQDVFVAGDVLAVTIRETIVRVHLRSDDRQFCYQFTTVEEAREAVAKAEIVLTNL